ncbi:MAG: hypothetical protein AAGF12_28090 [Myxococcota bacterium]
MRCLLAWLTACSLPFVGSCADVIESPVLLVPGPQNPCVGDPRPNQPTAVLADTYVVDIFQLPPAFEASMGCRVCTADPTACPRVAGQPTQYRCGNARGSVGEITTGLSGTLFPDLDETAAYCVRVQLFDDPEVPNEPVGGPTKGCSMAALDALALRTDPPLLCALSEPITLSESGSPQSISDLTCPRRDTLVGECERCAVNPNLQMCRNSQVFCMLLPQLMPLSECTALGR